MGIFTGPAPGRCHAAVVLGPVAPVSDDELVDWHCLNEARREVRAWSSGEAYVWRPHVRCRNRDGLVIQHGSPVSSAPPDTTAR